MGLNGLCLCINLATPISIIYIYSFYFYISQQFINLNLIVVYCLYKDKLLLCYHLKKITINDIIINMRAYRTVCEQSEGRFEVKKSVFISILLHIEDEEDVLKKIEQLKKNHNKARHHCYAYILGEDKEHLKYFDDGEPSGTAGKPILNVLEKNDLTDVLLVVIRYFGGIKLGATGLTRAYSKVSILAVEATTIIQMIPAVEMHVKLEYPIHGKIENYLADKGYKIKESNYNESVQITILVPQKDTKQLIADITEITNGQYESIQGAQLYIASEG